MGNTRKILGVLLAALLAFSLLPATALADDILIAPAPAEDELPYALAVSPEHIDFGTLHLGYTEDDLPEAETVAVTNDSDLTLALAMPPESDYFSCTYDFETYEALGVAFTDLEPGESALFTILPVTGLSEHVSESVYLAACVPPVTEESLPAAHVSFSYELNVAAPCTISFESNGGSEVAPIVAYEFEPIVQPEDPTREGYLFGGWFRDEAFDFAFDFDFDIVVMDTTLYARWFDAESRGISCEQSGSGWVWTESERAYPGDTVTLTVGADDGWAFERITVTDADGAEVAAEPAEADEEGEHFTFVMPETDVTVSATFARTFRFSDVAEGDWFCEAVYFCYDDAIMGGTGGDIFAPRKNLNRAMMVQILYNLCGTPEDAAAPEFSDVAADAWYADAVGWAAENGIVMGNTDGTFRPEDDITREQMVSILYRFAQFQGQDVSIGEETNILSYNDVFDTASYAMPAFQWACGAGLVSGTPEGDLNPKGTAQRAEVAQLMMMYMLA